MVHGDDKGGRSHVFQQSLSDHLGFQETAGRRGMDSCSLLGKVVIDQFGAVRIRGSSSTAPNSPSQRARTIIRTRPFGRSVIPALALISCPATNSSLHFCARVASTRVASAHAKPSPMHWRGPAE